MPAILNYSTSVSVEQSISEIQRCLVEHGASTILCDYDGGQNITSLSFKIKTERGDIPFRLPADPRPVMQIINEQTEVRITRRRYYGSVTMRAIPKRFHNDMDQARRVAWRILKDWVEAQMAIVEIGMVKVHQVFLPYAITRSGETVFERIESGKAGNLLGYDGKGEQ